MLPLLLCSILDGTASTGGLEAFRVLVPPSPRALAVPPGTRRPQRGVLSLPSAAGLRGRG